MLKISNISSYSELDRVPPIITEAPVEVLKTSHRIFEGNFNPPDSTLMKDNFFSTSNASLVDVKLTKILVESGIAWILAIKASALCIGKNTVIVLFMFIYENSRMGIRGVQLEHSFLKYFE